MTGGLRSQSTFHDCSRCSNKSLLPGIVPSSLSRTIAMEWSFTRRATTRRLVDNLGHWNSRESLESDELWEHLMNNLPTAADSERWGWPDSPPAADDSRRQEAPALQLANKSAKTSSSSAPAPAARGAGEKNAARAPTEELAAEPTAAAAAHSWCFGAIDN